VAGPCSVENEEMIVETARRVESRSKTGEVPTSLALRPMLSKVMVRAPPVCWQRRAATGLGIITEVMELIWKVAAVADIVQVRNMHNFPSSRRWGSG